jgi:glycosyltransferase involved in cell wall biosynthesis
MNHAEMNILYISPAYHPLIGGAETHVRVLAEGMAARGHKVIVVTDRRRSESPLSESLNGVEVLRTHCYRDWRDQPDRVPWEESLFGLLREFNELLNGQKIDLIHAHCQVSAMLGAMMKGSLNCKLIVTMHETQPELDPLGNGRSQVAYAHLPYDGLIACSQFFREQAIRYGAPANRVRMIYYGIDLEQFSPSVSGKPIRVKLGITDSQPLVLLVGRFKARKGILEFIRAMSKVVEAVPSARGLIAGSCNSASLDYANAVHREIETLGLQKVIMIEENWGLDDMPQVYAAADLVVQPSYAEGLGIAVLEAMATRNPVIGTDVSGIREVITSGQNGLLVPSKTSGPLAEAIVQILSNPVEASRLATNGYIFVKERFGIERVIDKTLLAYQEILDKNAK